MKLYTFEKSPLGKKVLIAAKYAGIELEVHDMNQGDNTTPDFLAKNPLGKVPVLETEEGCIWESNAICRYVARYGECTQLLGSTEYETGLIDQWLDFASGEILLPAAVWIRPILGFMENNEYATKKAQGDIHKVLGILNETLADKTFLVGERISLADIAVSTSLVYLFTLVLDPGFRKPFVNVLRWFNTLINQDEFVGVLGQVTLCTKRAVAAKKSEGDEKPAKHEKPAKQEKSEKKEQPKKQEKKKKEKEEDEDDMAEYQDKEEKKGPNPLDQLPPSPFVLDEWKRFYSNNDIKDSIPWFWEKFDRQGYSLWIAEYKYNAELEKSAVFKTCNLVGGFIQRLDKLRKYGFGSVLIFEGDNNLEISSAWLFRGQDVPAEMKDCDDYELYSWRKADPDNEDDKKRIKELWAWAGDFGGKKFIDQGKVFK